MRVRLRTPLIATAAIAAAVAVYISLTLPRASLHLDVARPAAHVLGAYHVHTTRSDGSGTIPDIAAAARRAGLQFVILTDHGDATRQPDAPAYISDVLVIDAVEVNSRDGHIVALGLEGASPYPLAGPARAVLEDIHRLGGAGIAAHPDSPKASLRWQAMNQAFDGIEWLNADSEWRDETPSQLIGAAARSLLRTPESIASLFARPDRTLQRWDNAVRGRPVFGVAATDAHARIGWREDEEPRERTALERPSYESLFRTLAQTVVLDAPLARDATGDARRVVEALRAGRSYSIIRALADPAALSFSAEQAGGVVPMGGRSPAGAPVTFRADVLGAPGARVVLMRNGRRTESGLGRIAGTSVEPGVYRVEALLPDSPFPWIVSNPIVVTPVGGPGPLPGPPMGPADPADLISLPISGPRWTVETDPQSKGFLQGDDDRIGLQYQLAGGAPRGQFAALAVGGHGSSGIDQVSFAGRASRPLRLSVQLRLPRGRDGERWVQSVYLDQTPRAVTLQMQDFEPVGIVTSRRPNGTPLHSILFVVDTVNTLPGTAGSFWVSDVSLRVDRLTQ